MSWMDIVEAARRGRPPTKKEIEQVLDYRSRKARARFFSDENFPNEAVRLVRAKGAHVLTVREARRTGHPDENQAAFALKTGRILLTCDRDYLDEIRFPLIGCPTIVVCDFGSGSTSEMEQTFRCLRIPIRMPQFFDKWTKMDASRESWITYSRHLDGTTSRARYRVHAGRLEEWVD